MARPKGGDDVVRRKAGNNRRGGARGRGHRPRQVHVFTEGEVTEPEYIDIILQHGTLATPGRSVQRHFENATAPSKLRKPLTMVKAAVPVLRKVERQAKDEGLTRKDWNWPQVWVLFDRDQHPTVKEAMDLADREGVRWAYSHPCFELWRLLHYQNYTSTFGGVCEGASGLLRRQPGFAGTYGRNVRSVSTDRSKHVRPEQVLATDDNDRYGTARKHAREINASSRSGHPNTWDPYTDVHEFVAEGLLLSGY